MELKNHTAKIKHPLWQAAILIALGTVAIVIHQIFTWTIINNGDPLFPYQMMAMALFVFALFNSIISISVENKDKYLRLSVISMLLLVVIYAVIAFLFTRIFIMELATYRNIIFVFCLIYLILLSIVGLIRFLLELAAKSDEQMKQNDNKH